MNFLMAIGKWSLYRLQIYDGSIERKLSTQKLLDGSTGSEPTSIPFHYDT